MSMEIRFPTRPQVGDDFLADNGSTYIWTGDRWSSAAAVTNGLAQPVFDGEYASSVADTTLEGGVEHIIGAN
jgi:hypothetical protein